MNHEAKTTTSYGTRNLDRVDSVGDAPSGVTGLPLDPDIVATLEIVANQLENSGNLATAHWRIEVKNGGKYWGWRRGSGKSRESRYGGKFGKLSTERQAAYEKNRASYSRTMVRNSTTNFA